MKFFTIKVKIVLLVVLSLLLTAFVIIFVTNNSYKNVVNLLARQTLDTSQKKLELLEKNEETILKLVMESIIANKKNQDLFIKYNRDELYNYTAPFLKKFKNKYGITRWSFYEVSNKNSICFLRVHDPKKFDDKISGHIYNNASMRRIMIFGKETDKTTFILKVISPYYSQISLLTGYLELGKEIDSLLDLLKQETDNDYALIIDKKYLDEAQWSALCAQKKIRNNWNDEPDKLLIYNTSTDDTLFKYKEKIVTIPDEGIILDTIKKNKKVYIKGLIPVFDAFKNKSGAIVILKDITKIYNEMIQVQIITIIVFVFFVLSIPIVSILILGD